MKPLAEKIRQAPHAGKAKRYSKEIPDEITAEWESKNIDIMHEIISAKASQVSEFKTALIESDGYYLAEVRPMTSSGQVAYHQAPLKELIRSTFLD